MSGIVPKKKLERVAWYQARLASWNTNASAIGTTAGDVSTVEARVAAAQSARQAQELALAKAKVKTAAFYAAVVAMTVVGAGVIKQVRAKGETTGNPNVYELAMIPAPAVPTNRPAPGKPTDFVANLQPDGSLKLAWKCANPAGTTGTLYHIYRRNTPADEWKFVGGTGDKKHVDNTVPAGVPRLYYTIQTARTTAIGVSAEFVVNFGINAGGAMTATVSTAQSASAPKLAA